jgi:ribosomal protein S18 acetylase RimI-like enzyme
MRVRVGRTEDAELLSALAIQVWLQTYATNGVSSVIARYVLSEFAPARFAVLLTESSAGLFVAEQGPNLLGYAVVKASAACPIPSIAGAELATLYVQPPFHGKGVGASLLKRAELWATERMSTPVWLKTNSLNGRAIAFYSKHGYTKVGITFFELGDEKHENVVLVGAAA